MNLKRWFFLFFSTLAIGGAASLLLGVVLVKWGEGLLNTIFGLIGHFGAGLLFSLIAQMGFFAYLAVHNFGLGLFRSLWSGVQVILIGFTFFDLVYFRYTIFGSGEGILPYFWFPLGILLFALIVAYVKVKQTSRRAGIPTVFLIVVVSTVEWMPALRQNQILPMLYMLIPLLLCNAWQVLILHKITTKKAPATRRQGA